MIKKGSRKGAKTAKAGIFFALLVPTFGREENIRHVKLREVSCSELWLIPTELHQNLID